MRALADRPARNPGEACDPSHASVQRTTRLLQPWGACRCRECRRTLQQWGGECCVAKQAPQRQANVTVHAEWKRLEPYALCGSAMSFTSDGSPEALPLYE